MTIYSNIADLDIEYEFIPEYNKKKYKIYISQITEQNMLTELASCDLCDHKFYVINTWNLMDTIINKLNIMPDLINDEQDIYYAFKFEKNVDILLVSENINAKIKSFLHTRITK